MGNISDALAERAMTLQHAQDVVDAGRKLLNPEARIYLDPVRLGDEFVVCGVTGPYTYRFGCPASGNGRWGAEVRNNIADPPDQYDLVTEDGPEAHAEASVITAWLLDIIDPPAAKHDCGLCDAPIRFEATVNGIRTWRCTDSECDWFHVSTDCCEESP